MSHHDLNRPTGHSGHLVGYVYLEDLLLNPPDTPLADILRKNEVVISVHDKRAAFSMKIIKSGVNSAPVVDDENLFLGIITANDVAVMVEARAEDETLLMSNISVKANDGKVLPANYFDTSFVTLLLQRLPWLAGLLILQSVSSYILSGYSSLIEKHLSIALFLTMLTGTGGNSGNQSSALVVRGLAVGEMEGGNQAARVLWREFRLSLVMGSVLAAIAFLRVVTTSQASILDATAICSAVFLVVVTAMTLGTALPLLLNRLHLDPAHSAAPFLSTLVDIAGVLITCAVCSIILSSS